MGIDKHRQCAKCHKDQDASQFIPTASKFHPGGRSIYCIDCLERMVAADDLAAVDKLMQWLDVPFLINQWTRLWKIGGDRTLHLYLKFLQENQGQYGDLDWTDTNKKWKIMREQGVLQNEVHGAKEEWLREMAIKWPSNTPREEEDYVYLENFYNDLISTQSLVSATQRDDAKRLCEVGLLATKKIRNGLDAKNEMAIYHNIVKTEGFEPKNAKNIGDFDSVGELFTWLERRGWKPKWHTEPQDSVDFTIKNIQKYLQRLVTNEGSIGDQVENRRKQLELADRLEKEYDYEMEQEEMEELEEEGNIEYEGAALLEEDLNNDDALN